MSSSSRIINSNHTHRRQPTKFRVIIKSKCGFYPNNVDEHEANNNRSLDLKSSSKMVNSNGKDIKDYVKTMKHQSNNITTRRTKTIVGDRNHEKNDDDNKSVRSVNSCIINRVA